MPLFSIPSVERIAVQFVIIFMACCLSSLSLFLPFVFGISLITTDTLALYVAGLVLGTQL